MLEDIQGIAFPFRIDSASGGVTIARGRDKLRQNVRLLLGTRLGERPMQRDFGTRIPSLAHDPNDEVLADLLQNEARQALLQWEPRVLITEMFLEQNAGEARMRLNYIYTGEQIADQMVLPLG
jgi:uncharacterized protein